MPTIPDSEDDSDLLFTESEETHRVVSTIGDSEEDSDLLFTDSEVEGVKGIIFDD